MAHLKGLAILVLLIVAAGTGGYFYGTQQRFAPVEKVAPGTLGAVEEAAAPNPIAHAPSESGTTTGAAGEANAQSNGFFGFHLFGDGEKKKAAPLTKKYWLHSVGASHVGYVLTASVNGTQVAKFTGPGQSQDITALVRTGENQIAFQAKALPGEMNEHKGDAASALSIQVIANDGIDKQYTDNDVLLKYGRSGADTGDYSNSLKFVTLE